MQTKPISIARLLTLMAFLLGAFTVHAQTFYALQIDRKIRAQAVEITKQYQPRLVMGADQALQFKQVVARFLVKKRAVDRDTTLSPKARYGILKQLSSKETSAMADVLESYRWREYMRIKPMIQPLPEPDPEWEAIAVQDATKL